MLARQPILTAIVVGMVAIAIPGIFANLSTQARDYRGGRPRLNRSMM